MAALALALAHPVAPIAWWAINSPTVQDAVAGVFQAESDSANPRQLQAVFVDEEGEVQDFRWAVWVSLAVGICVPILFWAIAATMYKSSVTDRRPPFPAPVQPELSLSDGRDFKYGLCACCDDCQYCLHGAFCAPMRAGDTYQALGISGYWCVVFGFFLTWLLAQILSFAISYVLIMTDAMPASSGPRRRIQNNIGNFAYYVAEIFLALWLASQRRKLRERLGDTQPGGKYLYDCITYWFCSCCNIVQDARQVDEAEGVRVECCCNLVKTAPPVAIQPPVVGNAVVVGQVIG